MIKDRIAIIDLGTNTFNLLIVDKKPNGFDKLHSDKEGVGLGLGGINENRLAPDAMQRGIETLRLFKAKCNEWEVERIKAFGTSALRDATNREVFLGMIRDEIQLEVEIISGSREAELIHQGVKIGYPFSEPALIMDIGGGSTEFIYANAQEIIKSQSFNIGTARIYDKFQLKDPLSQKNIQEIITYLETNTKGFFDDIQTNTLIGASGSFETFYALLTQRVYEENGFEELPTEALYPVLDKMMTSTLDERMKNPFIIPIRKKMGPIAAIKIKWVMEKLAIHTLTISPYAMKEGVIQIS
ncbi:MAG: hypothetical protein WDZ35_12390 [Crocinitomicaceae bacterium]